MLKSGLSDYQHVKSYSDYDKFAWIYNKHWGDAFTSTAKRVLEKLLLSRLPPRARILDLCCGTGQLAKVLSSEGFDVTGIDGSPFFFSSRRRHTRFDCDWSSDVCSSD